MWREKKIYLHHSHTFTIKVNTIPVKKGDAGGRNEGATHCLFSFSAPGVIPDTYSFPEGTGQGLLNFTVYVSHVL